MRQELVGEGPLVLGEEGTQRRKIVHYAPPIYVVASSIERRGDPKEESGHYAPPIYVVALMQKLMMLVDCAANQSMRPPSLESRALCTPNLS